MGRTNPHWDLEMTPGSPSSDPSWDEIYEQLRQRATQLLRRRTNPLLQTTVLVHETCFKIAEQRAKWKSSSHLLAIASQLMRRVLQDEARRQQSDQRHQEGFCRLPSIESDWPEAAIDFLDLEEILQRLEQRSPRGRVLVELRFYGGLTVAEIARALGVSTSTVEKELKFLLSWIRREWKAPRES